MNHSKVFLYNQNSYEINSLKQKIHEIFTETGCDMLFKPGSTVLLKPNFIKEPSETDSTSITHSSLLIAICQCLMDLKTNPVIGDSPAWGTVLTIAKKTELHDFCQSNNIPLLTFKKLILKKNSFPFGPKKIPSSKELTKVDHIINVPKIKSHCQVFITLSVKNLYGCIPGKLKALLHNIYGKNPDTFIDLILANALSIQPDLNIADGITAMHRSGPLHGKSLSLGLLAASKDMFALDQIISYVISVPDKENLLLNRAKFQGILKNSINDIQTNIPLSELNLPTFDHVEQLTPMQFSLFRVIKSITKNLFKKL